MEDQQNTLVNYNNYYIYSDLAKNGKIVVNTNDITINTWEYHYNGILNMLKDGIETQYVQNLFITVRFDNGEEVDLNIMDYYINIILWYIIVYIGDSVEPKHLFFHYKGTVSDDIKSFVDDNFVIPNRIKVPNRILNNAIADMLHKFVDIDNFSLFFADTLNLEDDIDLMNASPEYYGYIHCDLSNVPIDNVKDAGLEITNKAIEIIKDSKNIMGYEHCLVNPFISKEGINVRQYKENNFNIGTKPDGKGSVYHDIINSSYITGGLDTMTYQFIDSGSSRVAQIISKKNVGDSGKFARILGLNNTAIYLHPDPNYDCHTRNFEVITIPDEKHLRLLVDRYYRFSPNGVEYKIGKYDTFLIGKTIYLRSPMTCASHAQGNGVCYKCYGDLAYTNADISIGRYATEYISSKITQQKLSAKHLLETIIKHIVWCDDFNKFFNVDINSIELSTDLLKDLEALEGWKIKINPENIDSENEDDFFSHKYFSNSQHDAQSEGEFYNEFITSFVIVSPKGKEINIFSIPESEEDSETKMYISSDFATIIRDCMNEDNMDEDGNVYIPMTRLEDMDIFYIKVENNDIGKNLDILNDLLNKKAVTTSFTKDHILERLQDVIIKSKINCMSVHIEVLLANQIRAVDDILGMPNWLNPDEPYQLIPLNDALTDNPSIIISNLYQKLAKSFYYPLSFRKTAPSIFDPMFMRKPKKFLEVDHEVWDEQNKSALKPGESPVLFIHDKTMERPKNTKEYIEPFRKNIPKTELED